MLVDLVIMGLVVLAVSRRDALVVNVIEHCVINGRGLWGQQCVSSHDHLFRPVLFQTARALNDITPAVPKPIVMTVWTLALR